MKVLLIANPRSGKGKTKKLLPRLGRAIEGRGNGIETVVTQRPGHARETARTRAKDFDAIVVAGGDGTVNEVVNGLAASSVRTPVLPLMLGTSNSLARELKMPSSLDGAVALLDGSRRRSLDLGEVTWPGAGRRLFFLCTGAGLDAWAAHRLARARRGGTSFAAWTARAVEGFFRYRFPEISVSVDGRELAPARTVVIANLRTYGGPLVMADGASPEDGKLDVVCMRGEWRPELLKFLWASWRARISKTRGAEIVQGTRVELAGEKVPFELDGDPAGTLPVRIKILPGAAVFFSP